MQLLPPAYYVPRGVIEIKSQPETRSLFGEACQGRVGVRDGVEVESHRRTTLESAKDKKPKPPSHLRGEESGLMLLLGSDGRRRSAGLSG